MSANGPPKLTESSQPNPGMQSSPEQRLQPVQLSQRLRGFAPVMLGLALCFGIPLWNLIRLAAGSQLYSYILLVPFISLYLVWLKKQNLPFHSRPARKTAAGFLAAGAAVIITYWFFLRSHLTVTEDDYLALMMVSFLLFFWGNCCLFFGKDTLRAVVFPLGFLIFIVPMPAFMVNSIDTFLQYGSATAAQAFFKLWGTPYLNDGLVFQLPGINLKIAQECSGIHSSLVLFITSLLASYLFLRTPWKRILLVLVVIPLGIIRNGFRVFVIGELCVHIGPQMINSPIHRKGGPIFFILSLIPLFLLLIVLYKSERRNKKSGVEISGM